MSGSDDRSARYWKQTTFIASGYSLACVDGDQVLALGTKLTVDPKLDTRNNRDFGDAMIRSVFDEVSVGI